MNLQENLKVIRQLLTLSRFDWSFIFSGLYFMVSLFFALNRYDLVLGYISMYLIAMGHLSLNGLYDKATDSLNERNLSLQNPFAENKAKEKVLLTTKHVYIWVSFLWSIALIGNIFFLPYNNVLKIMIAIAFFSISITFSIIYSKPPLRLKGKPIIDLASTFLVFGLFFPLYSAFITMNIEFTANVLNWTTYIPNEIIFFGILFNIALLVGMHMPTVLGDLEFDKAAGDRTTAVFLGWENGSKITVLASLARTAALTIIVTWLALTNVLTVNLFLLIPYLLCIPDLYNDIQLWRKCNRQSAVNLWKSIIFTSIAGGFSIGYLYFTKNPDLLDQYFAPLIKLFLKL
jgi:hypothetical protein